MPIPTKNITPVLLAGGRGSRLRPLTALTPKPFLKLPLQKYSLFQETLRRCGSFAPPLIVCGAEHTCICRAQLAELGITDYHILAEPESRNTAPAIFAAMSYLQGKAKAAIIMPTDHYMSNPEAISRAAQDIDNIETIHIFGVKPSHAATRYGYVLPSKFVEKPNAETAQNLITQGALWNTGIFLCAPKTLCAKASIHIKGGDKISHIEGGSYKAQQAISIDYAFFNALTEFELHELRTGWADLGTLASFAKSLIRRFFK